jgi:flavin-binding protein dodecin
MVVKIIELIGTSPKSWEDATKEALDEAAKTIKGIKSIHVKRCTAKVKENKIVEYRAVVKIAFEVKREALTLLQDHQSITKHFPEDTPAYTNR